MEFRKSFSFLIGEEEEEKKTFTQEELNTIMAKEKRKQEEKYNNLMKQLEEVKESTGLSQKEKEELEARLEKLREENMTKEELMKNEKEKLSKDFSKKLEEEQKQRQFWRNNFVSAEINRALSDAAIEHDAFDKDQIIALLRPNTELVEDLDDEGKPTGSFIPQIAFRDTDKDGKEITLKLSARETVKRMKEKPEKFGNLFKTNATGGVGMMSMPKGKSGDVDLSKMSINEYMKYRKSKGG